MNTEIKEEKDLAETSVQKRKLSEETVEEHFHAFIGETTEDGESEEEKATEAEEGKKKL